VSILSEDLTSPVQEPMITCESLLGSESVIVSSHASFSRTRPLKKVIPNMGLSSCELIKSMNSVHATMKIDEFDLEVISADKKTVERKRKRQDKAPVLHGIPKVKKSKLTPGEDGHQEKHLSLVSKLFATLSNDKIDNVEPASRLERRNDSKNNTIFKEDDTETKRKNTKSDKIYPDASVSNFQSANNSIPSYKIKKKKRGKNNKDDNELIIQQLLESTLTPKSTKTPKSNISYDADLTKRPSNLKNGSESPALCSDSADVALAHKFKEATKKRSKTKTKVDDGSFPERKVFEVVQSKPSPRNIAKPKITGKISS